MFKIEKGIPIPKRVMLNSIEARGAYMRYPFADMEEGDSFAAPLDCYHSLCSSCVSQRKRNGKRFIVRKCVIDNEIVGVRCWRVE